MPPPYGYLEIVDSISPSSIGCSLKDGRAVATYKVTGDLPGIIQDLLGTTLVAATDGRVNRVPPKAHPQIPQWFASAITDIRGVGKPDVTDSVVGEGEQSEAPTLPQYAEYPDYFVTVEYSPRPYRVLTNPNVDITTEDFYDFNGVLKHSQIYREYLRYTETMSSPLEEYVTAQQGQMLFRTNDANAPNNKAFAGMPRISLNNQTVKLLWHCVPYAYVQHPDSYIRNLRGLINQNKFLIWEPGELLYLSYDARPYTPPVAELTFDVTAAFWQYEKLCDIEFTFLETRRPTDTDRLPVPTNKNWVPAGHNLLPYIPHRKFYYATSFRPPVPPEAAEAAADDPDEWIPLWFSWPFSNLFQDPRVGIILP
jgi:hypothetical protein